MHGIGAFCRQNDASSHFAIAVNISLPIYVRCDAAIAHSFRCIAKCWRLAAWG
jgi:hypothetical protein